VSFGATGLPLPRPSTSPDVYQVRAADFRLLGGKFFHPPVTRAGRPVRPGERGAGRADLPVHRRVPFAGRGHPVGPGVAPGLSDWWVEGRS